MQVERLSFKELDESKPADKNVHNPFRRKMKVEDAPPPPAPMFNEAQLKAAEREGYKKGFIEGTAEGKKQAESEQAQVTAKLAETAEKFAQSLQPLLDAYRKMSLATRQDMPKIALAIAKKVTGKSLAENAPAEIEDLATRVCATLLKEPKITITVQERLGDRLAKQLEDMTARLQSATDIVILRDPAMPDADCRIEWEHGCMERKTDQIWKQLENTVENMSAAAIHEPLATEPVTPIKKE